MGRALPALLALTLWVGAAPAAAPPEAPPKAALTLAGEEITVEVARTPAERRRGLSGRRELPPNHGMLFVYREAQPIAMWMRDTYLPLSVAFIDGVGEVINIEQMSPETDTVHRSARRARFALEMPRGWFAEHGVEPGTRVEGLDTFLGRE